MYHSLINHYLLKYRSEPIRLVYEKRGNYPRVTPILYFTLLYFRFCTVGKKNISPIEQTKLNQYLEPIAESNDKTNKAKLKHNCGNQAKENWSIPVERVKKINLC